MFEVLLFHLVDSRGYGYFDVNLRFMHMELNPTVSETPTKDMICTGTCMEAAWPHPQYPTYGASWKKKMDHVSMIISQVSNLHIG